MQACSNILYFSTTKVANASLFCSWVVAVVLFCSGYNIKTLFLMFSLRAKLTTILKEDWLNSDFDTINIP